VSNGRKVLIITVNFRHAECTLQFLKSASAMDGFGDCHLVVVDNNSCDGSTDRIRQAIDKFSNVELMTSSSNRGYFGAAKWALDEWLGQHGALDWVIVCNNDIVFDSPSFLARLYAHDPDEAGVLAPAIISSLTGFDSNPMILRRPGRIRKLRYRFLVSTYYVAWLTQTLAPLVRKGRRRLLAGRPTRPDFHTRIYAPHGSFIIFSRRFFEEGGFIDDGGFLYAEEISVAETCWRLGLPVIHDPQLRVSHNDSQTTGRMLTRNGYLLQRKGLHYALGKYLESGRGA
jgi:GT2 family glycosyltransferase